MIETVWIYKAKCDWPGCYQETQLTIERLKDAKTEWRKKGWTFSSNKASRRPDTPGSRRRGEEDGARCRQHSFIKAFNAKVGRPSVT